jgi:hypothetical protein
MADTPAAPATMEGADPGNGLMNFLRKIFGDMDLGQMDGLKLSIVQFFMAILGMTADENSMKGASATDVTRTDYQGLREAMAKGQDINQEFRDNLNNNGVEGGWPSSPLAAAVRFRDIEGVRELLKPVDQGGFGADVNANGGLAMIQAINNRDLDVVKMLHEEYGANLEQNGVVLSEAIVAKDTEIAKYILENTPGAQGSLMNQNGYGVVWAAANNDPSMIRLLNEHGADVNQQGGEALIRAIQTNGADSVKALIVAGADVNRNPDILKAAVNSGDPEILKAVIEGGADVTKIDMEVMDGEKWQSQPEVREAVYNRLSHPEDAGKPLMGDGQSVLAAERALQASDAAPVVTSDRDYKMDSPAKTPGLG